MRNFSLSFLRLLSLTLPHALCTIKKSWKKSITHLSGFNDRTWRSREPMSHAVSGNTVLFYCFVTADSRGILIYFWWNVAFKSLALIFSLAVLPSGSENNTYVSTLLLKSLTSTISYSLCWMTKVRLISLSKLKQTTALFRHIKVDKGSRSSS